MKKIVWLLIVLLGVAGVHHSGSAIATNWIQAKLFLASIYHNDQKIVFPPDQPMVLINEKAYVPLRFYTETAGLGLQFDQMDNTIRTYSDRDHHTSIVLNDILFKISTPKSSYKTNEPVSIWCSAEYIGKEPSIKLWANFSSGDIIKPIWVTIGDQDGFSSPLGFDDTVKPIVLQKDKPVIWNSTSSITKYLFFKSNHSDYKSFEKTIAEAGTEGFLPQGDYSINARMKFQLDGDTEAEETITLQFQVND